MYLNLKFQLETCCFVTLISGQATEALQKYESIYVPKGTNYSLMASNNITLTKPRCFYLEVYVLILMKEGNVSASRLASIPLQELKTGSITGVITNQTREKFQLGKVSFLCIINKKSTYNHGEFKLHLKLEIVIPEAATNNPLFDEVDLMVRCLKRNDIRSLGTRQEAGHYHLVYSETSKF